MGLRSDNSWILDAMYIDQARMRNRVCTDLWNSFNNVPYIASEPTALNGTRGYMTEVFLNNQYRGIYCLTEKVDRKQLQIKKSTGNMYKADNWSGQVMFKGVIPYDNTSDTWGAWELEYPDLGDNPAPNWKYLYDIVNFVATSSDVDFKSQIANKVDIDNIVDYYIFVNSIGAFDNLGKNTYFSFYSSTNNKFFYTMWDMDGTFGRMWDGSTSPSYTLLASDNNLVGRLLKLNPGNFIQKVKTRWNALKSNQLSKSTVNSRIEVYKNLLINTNAFAREKAKWTNITQDLSTEAAYMESWYSSRYDQNDVAINALGN